MFHIIDTTRGDRIVRTFQSHERDAATAYCRGANQVRPGYAVREVGAQDPAPVRGSVLSTGAA